MHYFMQDWFCFVTKILRNFVQYHETVAERELTVSWVYCSHKQAQTRKENGKEGMLHWEDKFSVIDLGVKSTVVL